MKKSLLMVFNQVCLLLPVAKKMADSVVGVLKNIAEISNTNIIKNANVLLSKSPVDSEVEWVHRTPFVYT